MKTRGPSLFLFSLPLLVACGAGSAQQPANAPTSDATTTTTTAAAEPKKAEPAPEAPKAEGAPASETAPAAAEAEPAPEPCPQDWVCLRVPLDGKGKIEKRATRLVGDPKIDTTWSANVDTARPGTFPQASKPVEIALRLPMSKPGQHLAQVVLKANGREIVLDKHEGEEITYVGVIAAEKEGDGAILVDLRYMK